jgi:hypothetical protein
MKNFKSAAIVAALTVSLALGGCSTIESLIGGGSLGQSAPTVLADAEKALTVAHLAYQGIGISLQQAAQSGALHGPNATTAQGLYDKIGGFLDTADAADAALNAQGVLDAVTQADALVTQINSLIPKK